MVSFQPFDIERIMSTWEHKVDYNLTESGAHPMKVCELIETPELVQELLEAELNYPVCNGSQLLREEIASLYRNASAANVLVTVGCAEANYISLQTLLEPGDEIVVMMPNYLQLWGLASNWGMARREFHLQEESGWAPDLSELAEKVTTKTKIITVCNPNNPTGRILTGSEMDAIISIASNVNAWIIADETYKGAERTTDEETPSFWGNYDKVLATASLSKAYGLPGLRLGWVIAPEKILDELWMRHEYTTISATMLGNHLAEIALSNNVRPRLIERARGYIRRGYPVLKAWIDSNPEIFSVVPPQATAVAFVKYHIDWNSTDLVEQLIRDKSIFLVPGDCFGMDHHLRISFGMDNSILEPALDRVAEFFSKNQRHS